MSDHPIFTESIRRIRELLQQRVAVDDTLGLHLARLSPLERDVLERCIHSSGDVSIAADLRFSPVAAAVPMAAPLPMAELFLQQSLGSACEHGQAALRSGAPILTDTAMAAAAVTPMARRTGGNRVACVLDWAPGQAPPGSTRAAVGMERAWAELALAIGQGAALAPVVLIGSAPTALERLLDLVASGAPAPSLIIGMPVGFVGVAESKRHLAESGLDHIRLEGSRGGAGLVAAACNALLRAGRLAAENPPHLS